MLEVVIDDMENIYSKQLDWTHFDGKTVLITGAYGMLASYLVYFFLYLQETKDIRVNVLAQGRSEKKAKERFREYWDYENFTFIDQDILSPISITDNIDYIIHAASLASPNYYVTNPVEVSEPNAIGTYFLLKLAIEKKIKGFLFLSSGDVYGTVEEPNCISEEQMGKMNSLDLHSCYGESKKMAETWCVNFWREYKVPTMIARVAHTYGPTMDIENDPRVFASFLKCVKCGEDIVMLSDGTAKRPFTYITDTISAFLFLLIKGKPGEAYNVANEEAFVSIKELANILVSLRPELNLKVVYKARDINDNYLENNENKQNCLSTKKLKQLGWQCEYSVSDGFKRTLKSFDI